MSGLRKQKDYDWKDSNVANIKSKEDRDVSLHFEQLWSKLLICRGTLRNVQVVKNKSICVLTLYSVTIACRKSRTCLEQSRRDYVRQAREIKKQGRPSSIEILEGGKISGKQLVSSFLINL